MSSEDLAATDEIQTMLNAKTGAYRKNFRLPAGQIK